jgi:hypothetical protein
MAALVAMTARLRGCVCITAAIIGSVVMSGIATAHDATEPTAAFAPLEQDKAADSTADATQQDIPSSNGRDVANPAVTLTSFAENGSEDDCSTGLCDSKNDFRQRLGYDRGIFLNLDNDEDSFELKMNLRMQFRNSTFSPMADFWIDNAGVVRPIEDRQNFDTERARLILSGHAFVPEMKFFLQLDGDHDGGHFVDFFDYWWGWQFSDAFELQFGKRKVAAGRNWLLGAFDTRLADRPFSTDFFRPGRSVGVWIVGDPTDNSHYEIAATDGFRTDNLTPFETNNTFAFSGTGWWDPLGSYGSATPVDFESHNDPAMRVGYSWVTSAKGQRGQFLRDTDFVRLSDGTRLTNFGALGPGATVDTFDLALLAMDAGIKYRGWSLNAEYFLRWITDIKADMPLTTSGVFQHGFYVEGGYFVLPRKFEVNAHVANVRGDFGTTTGIAAGFSWYPGKTNNFKLTVDTTFIDGSPVNSTGSDILVGDHGILTRIQMQARF